MKRDITKGKDDAGQVMVKDEAVQSKVQRGKGVARGGAKRVQDTQG